MPIQSLRAILRSLGFDFEETLSPTVETYAVLLYKLDGLYSLDDYVNIWTRCKDTGPRGSSSKDWSDINHQDLYGVSICEEDTLASSNRRLLSNIAEYCSSRLSTDSMIYKMLGRHFEINIAKPRPRASVLYRLLCIKASDNAILKPNHGISGATLESEKEKLYPGYTVGG
jgi:hypothetical protein